MTEAKDATLEAADTVEDLEVSGEPAEEVAGGKRRPAAKHGTSLKWCEEDC